MTIFEVLKQASRITASLIGEKTPPIFETLRKAYVDLGELVDCAKRIDEVTPEFALAMNGLISRLEVFKASPITATVAAEEKAFTAEEFAGYFKAQIDKAIEEKPAEALRRLHALQAGIAKALGDQYAGPGNDASINLRVYVDPWQQASVEREGDGAPKTTSGTAQREEVTRTPGLGIEDLLKSAAKSVETAAVSPFVIDVGWSRDLASKEFLTGERNRDWGPDTAKG
jgi:hypothetical protein